VVNCTGTSTVVRPGIDPLADDLLTPRAGVSLGRLSTAGLGLQTSAGRLVDSVGSTGAPIWTLGSVRRGELYESTAIPEIRTQAAQIATAVIEEIAPEPRRLADGRLVGGHHPVARPRDPLGLALSTTAEAAAAYNAGLERLMRLQSGADEKLLEAVALDPEFAWRMPHSPCSVTRAGRRSTCARRWSRRGGPLATAPTTASAAWSTWSAVASRTSATPARPR
jgi:hypothetical protein